MTDTELKQRIRAIEAQLAAGVDPAREKQLERELAKLYADAYRRDDRELAGARAGAAKGERGKTGPTGKTGAPARARTAPAGATPRTRKAKTPALGGSGANSPSRGAAGRARSTPGRARGGRGARRRRSTARQVYAKAEPYGVSGWGDFFWRATGTAVGLSLLLLLLRNAEGRGGKGSFPIVETVAGGFANGLVRLMSPKADLFGDTAAGARASGGSGGFGAGDIFAKAGAIAAANQGPAGPAGPAGLTARAPTIANGNPDRVVVRPRSSSPVRPNPVGATP